MDAFCEKTYRKLSDEFLLDVYKKSKSVKHRIHAISEVLSAHTKSNKRKSFILASHLVMNYMIPSGVKASIRGNAFNDIVFNYLRNIVSSKKMLTLTREAFPDVMMDQTYLNEIPDWFIKDTKTHKLILGYNQIDLWTGGAQCNRAHKYLQNDGLYKALEDKYQCRLVCMIASPLPGTMKKTSKIYKILEEGFQKKRLIYIKQLRLLLQETMSR